jgi:hypothetical protein
MFMHALFSGIYTYTHYLVWYEKASIWETLRVKFKSYKCVDFGNKYPELTLLFISDLIGASSGLEVVTWKLIKGKWDNSGNKKCLAILVAV